MNLSQAKAQLEKIVALYKSMSADEKNISAIERDLMLSYIRSLYENFLDNTPSVSVSSTSSSNDSRPTVTQPVPPRPVVVETPPPPVQPRPIVVETPPPVQSRPVVVDTPPPPVQSRPTAVETPQPPQRPHPFAVEKPATHSEPVSYQAPPSVTSSGSPEIDALFEAPSDKELSDKLSNTAINDLTKAFGLNDRLLMQNDLFGNNKAVFDEILKDLNNASSFESARGYLIDFAKRYNWTANPERQKHAKMFIKTVRRRFK